MSCVARGSLAHGASGAASHACHAASGTPQTPQTHPAARPTSGIRIGHNGAAEFGVVVSCRCTSYCFACKAGWRAGELSALALAHPAPPRAGCRYGSRGQQRRIAEEDTPRYPESRNGRRQGSSGAGGGAAAAGQPAFERGGQGVHRLAPTTPFYSNLQGGQVAGEQPSTLQVQQQQQEQQAQGMQLGTWAERKRVFSEHLRQEEDEQQTRAALPPASPVLEEAGPAGLQQSAGRQGQQRRPRASSPPQRIPSTRTPPATREPSTQSTESDSELHAAWRWRFSRKWQVCAAQLCWPGA